MTVEYNGNATHKIGLHYDNNYDIYVQWKNKYVIEHREWICNTTSN